MAEKEATVYVLDLGHSMGEKHQGRSQSDLEWAMTYVWEKITSIVALDRKTTYQGVLGFRTDDTDEEFEEQGEGYSNISVIQGLGQLLLPALKELQHRIQPSHTNNGDAVSAVVIAIQMISKFCKKLKYKKRIVLVTNASGHIDGDDIPPITEKLTSENIELVVVGVDFDDPEYGFKEEDKDPIKAANEKTLSKLAEDCNGVFGTMLQAIEELGTPRLKSTRPVPSYKGQLTLGHPDKYDSAMVIDVERYPRVAIRRPATASSFVLRSSLANGDRSEQSSATVVPDADEPMGDNPANPLASVHHQRAYQVVDESAPGGKRNVEREDLAKGYEYGRTAVHISESDENVTKLETSAGLDIIGFIAKAQFERYMAMSVSHIIIAQRTNNKAIIALSSLIHALYELEDYAIARLVTKDGKEPDLRLLAPSIEGDYECLLDVQLPFTEDVRQYKFPPLDRVSTVSGKKITEHRNLPSDALQEAMSDYVDSMDISNLGKDDEGNPSEYMQMTDTFSPVLHRIDQAVRWRAVHPDEPIPPPYDILTRYMYPPEEVVRKSKPDLEELIAAANVKKVPPKTQARKRTRNEVKPLSGLDVGALLGSKSKSPKISKENAIPEFRQAIENTESPNGIKDAAKQLGLIIEAQIRDSFADQAYESALEKIGALREEMIDVEEPVAYNDFLKQLKGKLLGEELNGDRREMWWMIKKSRLGLITKSVSAPSDVDDEAAKDFLSSR